MDRIPAKKVLLMGAGGSGKTSMKSIIFANYVARSTSRIAPTVNVESSQVRFLGNLVLNLWDCGGQSKFMKTYLGSHQEHIFKNVSTLIFVFDLNSATEEQDYEDYVKCSEYLHQYSKDAKVFCLLHKVDLIPAEQRDRLVEIKRHHLTNISPHFNITAFGTSIWHDSLYKAWSTIVVTLIPNAEIIHHYLEQFVDSCEAEEVVLFERSTFLDVSHASNQNSSKFLDKDPHRFERLSNIVKMFKLTCASMSNGTVTSIEVHNSELDAFIYEFTSTTYIMVIVSDKDVKPAATLMNISLARKPFEALMAPGN